MNDAITPKLSPKMLAAVTELKALVLTQHPDATFSVSRSDEDPSIINLIAAVDTDDPDEITDLVIDRMRELLVDEGLPIYVVPIRSSERVAAMLESTRRSASATMPTSALG